MARTNPSVLLFLSVAFFFATCSNDPELRHQAESPEEALYRGVDHLRHAEREPARAIFLELTRSNPRFPDAYRELFQMGVEEGRIEETIALFDQLAARDPGNGLAFAYKAMTLSVSGHVTESSLVFKRAVLADPNDIDLYVVIGYWGPFGGRSDEWRTWLEEEGHRRGSGELLALLRADALLYSRDAPAAARVVAAGRKRRGHQAWTAIEHILTQQEQMAGRNSASTALEVAEKASEEAIQSHSPEAAAEAASERAWAFENTGDLVQAVRAQLEALDLAKRADHRQLQAHAERNLARLAIWLNDLPEARRRLETAQPQVDRFDAPRGHSEINTIWGHYFMANGQFNEAAARYQEALKHWRKTGLVTMRTVDTLARLARAQRLIGLLEEAAQTLNEAETLTNEVEFRSRRATVRLEQARVALARGRRGEAMKLLEGGLSDDAATGDFSQPELLSALMEVRAGIGDRQGALQAGRQWAEAVAKQVSTNTPGQELDSFLEDKASVAERLFDLYFESRGSSSAETSLEVASSIRALVLRRQFGQAASTGLEHSEPGIRESLRRLRGPKNESPTLLALWTGTRKSYLWLANPVQIMWWQVPGRETLRRDIQRRINGLQEFPWTSRSSNALTEADPGAGPFPFLPADALGLLDHASSLIVAVDGPVERFPFEVILRPDGRRLFEKLRVLYTPTIAVGIGVATLGIGQGGSADVYAFPASAVDPTGLDTGGRPWACPALRDAIDPGSDARQLLFPSPLPAALEEARAVAASLAKLGYAVHISDHPTRQDFQTRALQGATVLHLALHACPDQQNSGNGYLVFGSPSQHDGLWEPLFARQIASSSLPYRLVTLSGCRTFPGREVAGEGTLGLERAFHQAGVPCVVSTLWNVQDVAARLLMEEFFKRLGVGERIDEALREAKLSMARSARPALRHPHFWASYRLSCAALADTARLGD